MKNYLSIFVFLSIFMSIFLLLSCNLPKDSVIKPNDEVIKPNDEVIKPNDEVIKPNDEVIKPNDEVIKPNDEVIKPEKPIVLKIEINAENGYLINRSYHFRHNVLFKLESQKNKNIKISINDNRNIRDILLIKKENLEDFKKAFSIEDNYYDPLNFIADDLRTNSYILNKDPNNLNQKRNISDLKIVTHDISSSYYRHLFMPIIYIKKGRDLDSNEEEAEQESYRFLRTELKKVADWIKINNI